MTMANLSISAEKKSDKRLFKSTSGYNIILQWSEGDIDIKFGILNENDQLQLSGNVKWDGCMNIEGHFHFCHENEIAGLSAMLLHIREQSEIMLKDNNVYTLDDF